MMAAELMVGAITRFPEVGIFKEGRLQKVTNIIRRFSHHPSSPQEESFCISGLVGLEEKRLYETGANQRDVVKSLCLCSSPPSSSSSSSIALPSSVLPAATFR